MTKDKKLNTRSPRKKSQATNKRKLWSARVTRESRSLTLEDRVFTRSPRQIAASLKRSAERSRRRKAPPFQSAMSMLVFYINRAGRKLPPLTREKLEKAKFELRKLFGKVPKKK